MFVYDIEEIDLLFADLEERAKKSISNLKAELQSMRVGRANVHVLDGITVDYYGVDTPLNQVANITIPEARLLCINVWDNSIIKKVEKAIIDANIGITPTNDGKNIRLVFPEPNEERRKALVKEVKTMGEKTKVAIRNIRRDILDDVKKFKKQNVITEDIQLSVEKDVDKYVADQVNEVEKIVQEKEQEIMKV
ncbi:MAG: ribosome recycling factor [Bacillota bacterium]|mgnify:CR=1 FL=1|jgi:ribosome recycling factor|nr:ribosome recycling factor [Bacillota bacterium]HHU42832.1 ribosome recycling factor [Clostridiales bacterium]